jgi:hypothetical protein
MLRVHKDYNLKLVLILLCARSPHVEQNSEIFGAIRDQV